MTPEEISARYEILRTSLTLARNEVERAQMEIRLLQRLCKHPNKRKYTDYDGSSGMFCPDCHHE